MTADIQSDPRRLLGRFHIVSLLTATIARRIAVREAILFFARCAFQTAALIACGTRNQQILHMT